MKSLVWILYLVSRYVVVYSQTRGTLTPNTLLDLPSTLHGQLVSSKVTLDANWRWSRNIRNNPGGTTNCYTQDWDSSACPDPVSCSKNCALEGISKEQWLGTYGISTQGNVLTLRYVTQHTYGTNVGSRVYLMADSDRYLGFHVLNQQFVMTVDVSQLPCGLNGAVYFAEMPLDGGKNSLNTAGASFGTGYGDAQCPYDIKYINGFTNTNKTGACSNEFDLWEANSKACAFTAHPCSKPSVYPCTTDQQCGKDSFRTQGVCDKNGADFNAYRHGDSTLYGPGSQFKVDTSQPFDIITQFITSDKTAKGTLVEVKRIYRQHGKLIPGGSITDGSAREFKKSNGESDHFNMLGGLKTMGESLRRGHVLVLSIWDDNSDAQMRWLDSIYPPGSKKQGDQRGPCPANDIRDTTYLRKQYASAKVQFSNIRLEPITSSTPSPTPPTPAPAPAPSSKVWQCKSCKLM
jgi:cellulose 1,4-beta-cellobiosidase